VYLFQKAQNKITLPRLFSSLRNQKTHNRKPQRTEAKGERIRQVEERC